MNPLVELNLALILFLPWYAVLAWLFWRMRARGSTAQRKVIAVLIVVAALAAAAVTGIWAYDHADISSGAIWKQILACVIGYWAFLTILVIGYAVLGARE